MRLCRFAEALSSSGDGVSKPCYRSTHGLWLRWVDKKVRLESGAVEDNQRSRRLRYWAREEGFDEAAVVALRPARHRLDVLEWLADGKHADMRYLSRRIEARLDPAGILPGAASALCVALRYHSAGGDDGSEETDFWRGVSRYARGFDYHDVMGKMLKRLGRRIERAFPGTATRWYVDTGPVLERDLAARSGLGAVGKNTCLLAAEGGSWFFLGELFTTLDLQAPNFEIADLCGSCSQCLEACPTGAFTAPYVLDARRCISYWTIEHRGDIPASIRPLLGKWVFGCDVCQDVCPHNEGGRELVHDAFRLAGDRAMLTLVDLLELDDDGFKRLFRGSPLKRAKLEGLKRNAIVAAGNAGSRAYLPALELILREGAPILRRHAAWAVGRILGGEARRKLERAAAREGDESVLAEISDALSRIPRSS